MSYLVYSKTKFRVRFNLSGLLADIFLDSLETKLLNRKSKINENVIYWGRYVDDVLVVWDGENKTEINDFYGYINNLHDNINFTIELEQNKNINFLDLQISHDNSNFNINIYRKPTQTDTIVPFDSHHHQSHKMAAIKCYLHRATSIPMSKEARDREMSIIKQIATNNSFTPQSIDRLIYKHNQKIMRTNTTTLTPIVNIKENKIYRSITYPGNIAYPIKNLYKKYNIDIVFKTPNTTKQILFNAKDKIHRLEDNGVYQLTCDTCSAAYIGETGRKLKERIKEHTVTRMNDSQFGRHIKFNEHNFDIGKGCRLLHSQNKGYKLELLEHYEINKFIAQNPDSLCLNTKVYTTKPPLYTYLKKPFPPPKITLS